MTDDTRTRAIETIANVLVGAHNAADERHYGHRKAAEAVDALIAAGILARSPENADSGGSLAREAASLQGIRRAPDDDVWDAAVSAYSAYHGVRGDRLNFEPDDVQQKWRRIAQAAIDEATTRSELDDDFDGFPVGEMTAEEMVQSINASNRLFYIAEAVAAAAAQLAERPLEELPDLGPSSKTKRLRQRRVADGSQLRDDVVVTDEVHLWSDKHHELLDKIRDASGGAS